MGRGAVGERAGLGGGGRGRADEPTDREKVVADSDEVSVPPIPFVEDGVDFGASRDPFRAEDGNLPRCHGRQPRRLRCAESVFEGYSEF